MGDEMGDKINPINTLTPFSEHVRTMHAGSIDSELTEALGNAVKLVRIHGGRAMLKIEVSIKSVTKDNDNVTVEFTKIEVKEPSITRPPSLMYATADGDLLRNDPNQGSLELREVHTTGDGGGAFYKQREE